MSSLIGGVARAQLFGTVSGFDQARKAASLNTVDALRDE